MKDAQEHEQRSLTATTQDKQVDEVIDMGTNGNGGDELDAEFERY